MSAPNETILIQVDIAANNQRLVELTKQLNENREAQKALVDANKAGRLSSDDLAAGQVRLKQTAADITQETRVLTKANADQDKANKASAGSIEQLRAELALGTRAYNALSQSERDSTESGQKLQANNKALSDQLKVLEKAVGDTRRNVGNYNEGIKDVNVVSGQLTSGLRTAVDKGLAPFKNEIERGTGLLGKFKSGNALVADGMKLLKGGGETGALGFKALAGGIALTGIGLFVLAISAVVAYFTQTAAGGKILAQVLGGLGTVLQVATDTVSKFGETIVAAVKNPKQAIEDLKNLIEQNLINRFKAFAVIFKAIQDGDLKQVTNGFLQLSTGVTDVIGKGERAVKVIADAAKAGAALVAEQKALIVARRELEIEDVKEQSRVNVLLRLSKERGKSATEQLAALKEAGRIEAELTEKNIALQQREAAAIKEAIRQKGAGKAADLKADLGAKEKEIAQTLAAQDETNAKIRVRESVFQQKLLADAEAARKKLDENKLKSIEADIAAGKSREEAAAKFLDDQLKADQLILSRAERARTEKRAADAAEYARDLAMLERNLATRRQAMDKANADGVIGEGEYNKQLRAIEAGEYAARLMLQTRYNQDTTDEVRKIANYEIKETRRVAAEKKHIEEVKQSIAEASLQAGLAATDATIAALGEETAAGQAALVLKKTLAIAEVGISLQKQLAANALTGAKISEEAPPYTVPLGIAYTIATDALAIATAAGAVANIVKFRQGGLLSGASHEQGGIPFTVNGRPGFEAEGGEAIMSKGAVQQFAPLLSHLNVLGGGVAFAAGGLVPGSAPRPAPIADGGFVARQLGGYAPPSAKEIAYELARVIPSEINVKSITKAQSNQAKIKGLATLGG